MIEEGWARQQMLWAMEQLDKMSCGTHGNVSTRLSATHFLIKPSGVPYRELTSQSFCHIRIFAYGGGMNPSTKINEDQDEQNVLRPSVDTVHHAAIYMNHPWVKAICHTHSDNVVAHAIASKDIPCCSTEQADVFGGTIPCLPYSDLDSWGSQVSFTEKGVPAVILARHGGLTVADDPLRAVQVAMKMEEVARKNVIASTLAYCIEPLPTKEVKKWRKRYLRDYGQK